MMDQEKIKKICTRFRDKAGIEVTFHDGYFTVVINIGLTANRQHISNDVTEKNLDGILDAMYENLLKYVDEDDFD